MKSIFSWIFVLGLLSTIAISGCKSNANGGKGGKTPEVKIETIKWGSYGGFTGQRLEYSLSKDGNVELYDSMKDQTAPFAKWSQEATNQIFKDVDALEIQNMQFNQPGNMSYFLGVTLEEDRVDVIWGAAEKDPPAEVEAMYKRLNAKTREE